MKKKNIQYDDFKILQNKLIRSAFILFNTINAYCKRNHLRPIGFLKLTIKSSIFSSCFFFTPYPSIIIIIFLPHTI